MSDDIDAVAATGCLVPFIGWNLRQHYGRIIRDHGLEAATTDARERYEHQVQCMRPDQLLPLTYPCRRLANAT